MPDRWDFMFFAGLLGWAYATCCFDLILGIATTSLIVMSVGLHGAFHAPSVSSGVVDGDS